MSYWPRYAIKPGATLGALDALAVSEGWTLIEDTDRGHAVERRRHWRVTESSGAGNVLWNEAHPLNARTIDIDGPESLVDQVKSVVPCYTREELVPKAHCPDGDDTLSLVTNLRALRTLIAAETGPCSQETFELFVPWSRHPRVEVRRAAFQLALGIVNPKFVPLLDERAQNDAELGPRWQQLAQRVREVWPNE